jgi:hypothetical protein
MEKNPPPTAPKKSQPGSGSKGTIKLDHGTIQEESIQD